MYRRFMAQIINLVVKSGEDALALHHVSGEVILAALQANGRLGDRRIVTHPCVRTVNACATSSAGLN